MVELQDAFISNSAVPRPLGTVERAPGAIGGGGGWGDGIGYISRACETAPKEEEFCERDQYGDKGKMERLERRRVILFHKRIEENCRIKNINGNN